MRDHLVTNPSVPGRRSIKAIAADLRIFSSPLQDPNYRKSHPSLHYDNQFKGGREKGVHEWVLLGTISDDFGDRHGLDKTGVVLACAHVEDALIHGFLGLSQKRAVWKVHFPYYKSIYPPSTSPPLPSPLPLRLI